MCKMKPLFFLFFAMLPCFIFGNSSLILTTGDETKEEQRLDFFVELINGNLKRNGWSNIICAGRHFPNNFYVSMNKKIPFSFTTIRSESQDIGLDGAVQYHSNMVILHCADFSNFEDELFKTMASPYWHPLSNTILYYQSKEQMDLPTIFMVFWFYKISNGIVVQYDDDEENFIVSYYNPYVGENYKLSNQYGCWKTKKGEKVNNFQKSFKCVEGCHNVTLHSKLRAFFVGTCIGYDTVKIRYGDKDSLVRLSLFEDKGSNLHGFVMKAHGADTLPFFVIDELGNGTYSLKERDGLVWNTAAERMNFSINFDEIRDIIKKPFNYNTNLQQILTFSKRQADLVVFPVYQFDFVVIELDLSIAYKDSGVCIVAHRAGFETTLFDTKLVLENTSLIIRFLLCVLSIWLLFFVFNTVEKNKLSFDQAGKDFVNTIRNILSISLYKPPERGSFRVYLFVSMWSFFIVNFATQAAIISFFAAYKRGKEMDTFEDILNTGYVIEGMSSPDMILPDDEERFDKFNSRVVSVPTMFECIERMSNNSKRFCLIDCSIGRYLARNKLNERGEQYLHIARDRIHSHYLNMIFHKYSPLTNTFNRYLRMAFEGGLIQKWEQYRYSDIVDEVPVKALKLEDLIGIFKCYYFALGISSVMFVIEVLFGLLKRALITFREKIRKWKRTSKKKQTGNVKGVHTFTQAV